MHKMNSATRFSLIEKSPTSHHHHPPAMGTWGGSSAGGRLYCSYGAQQWRILFLEKSHNIHFRWKPDPIDTRIQFRETDLRSNLRKYFNYNRETLRSGRELKYEGWWLAACRTQLQFLLSEWQFEQRTFSEWLTFLRTEYHPVIMFQL